jgi:hypothetical protein
MVYNLKNLKKQIIKLIENASHDKYDKYYMNDVVYNALIFSLGVIDEDSDIAAEVLCDLPHRIYGVDIGKVKKDKDICFCSPSQYYSGSDEVYKSLDTIRHMIRMGAIPDKNNHSMNNMILFY